MNGVDRPSWWLVLIAAGLTVGAGAAYVVASALTTVDVGFFGTSFVMGFGAIIGWVVAPSRASVSPPAPSPPAVELGRGTPPADDWTGPGDWTGATYARHAPAPPPPARAAPPPPARAAP